MPMTSTERGYLPPEMRRGRRRSCRVIAVTDKLDQMPRQSRGFLDHEVARC